MNTDTDYEAVQITDEIILVPLDKIVANPYQPRTTMDPVELEALAQSISRNSMMQKPTARRRTDGCYELAFGHRRYEAHKLLAIQHPGGFEAMPLIIRELSNEQMFEFAWEENRRREDINPIDQGEAYAIYMREFNKTSKEAGEYFDVSEETIRQKMRYGKLPDVPKELLRSGGLNESAGRALLTLTKLLPNDDETLKTVITDIVDDGDKPESAVERALSQKTRIIGNESNSHFSMKQKTFKYMPELTPGAAAEALDVMKNRWARNAFAGFRTSIEEAQQYLETHIEQNTDGEADQMREAQQRLNHLIKTPACTACLLFAQIDGTGYCGWSACFDRKAEATQQELLHKTSEKTGIAVLTADDGKHLELNSWKEKHKNYFNKKGADLRLKLGRRGYANWDGVPSDLGVVVVGKTLETWKKQEQKTDAFIASHENKPQIDYQRQRNIQRIVDAQVSLFAWEVIAPAFAVLLKEIKSEKILYRFYHEMGSRFDVPDEFDETFADEKKFAKLSKPARLNFLHRAVAFYFLDEDLEYGPYEKITHNEKNPASALSKHFQTLAQESGVKLPKDLAQKAQTYDDAVKLAISELDGAK